ncbi:MAG: class I SAM-dependent methyltransferase, partial [Saprospiraceae bacterium]|nr:class I SAM-dependent methyltransferase [Saprospiraceae bacterium]
MNPIEHHPEYDELEKHLHANLRDYAPEAPDRLWAGIEARLPKQRRRPVLWWWLGMMVLLPRVDHGFDPIHSPNTPSTAVSSVLPLNHVGYPISVSLPDGAMDFGYSLGVLHHIPDTRAALAACVRKLKPGAPFLLYLYYAFDNRPWWFKALWRLSDVVRRL